MSEENKKSQQQQTNTFQLLTFRYFPYWPLFAGLGALMLAIAWGYLHITPPVYETTATILIKDEKKGVENSPGVQALNIYTSKKIVENEIEVIKSKTLLRETVEMLHLVSPVFEEGLFSSDDAYTSSPISVEVKNTNEIQEIKRADFFYDEERELVGFQGKEYAINQWLRSLYGEIRFVRNAHLRNKGKGPFYFSLIDPRKVVYEMQKNLKVGPSNKLSTIVNLSIKDPVPVRAENILNALIESYNKAAVTDKNSLAANTLEFVEERIRFVEHDLDSVERNIQLYKSTRGIVDLSEQGKLFLKNVGDNDQKLSELNMQMAVLDKVEEYIVKKDNKAGIVPATLGLKDEGLSVLIQKLYYSEIQYERLKKTTAENNPILISLANEIQNMRPGILENIHNQRLGLIASRTNLISTNNRYASVLQTIPQKERELLEVNRQQSIKNNVYNFLLQKREETALSFASTVGDTRLVDKAASSIDPVAPKKMILFGGALAFAFFLAIALITLRELLSNKLLFRSEIETSTKTPIVAEISHSGLKDYVVIGNAKNPFLTEQFRQLRAALGLYGKTNKKILMITSSISGEGKSFISVNLATSLALSNKKVLLVDFDIRNPRITNYYNVNDNCGIAECLLGTENIEEVMRSTNIPGLFIIGAGQALSNPTEIILNGNIEEILKKVKQLFDYVIVDTSPVDPVTDAYVISPYCDATLFVVRHGKTPKTMFQKLDCNNKIQTLNNSSIVFNGVRSRGLVKGAYGYGYGYGYSYLYNDRSNKNNKSC